MKVDRILRLPEVENQTGIGKTTIYAGVRDRTFPQPVQLSPKSIGWRQSEVLDWMTTRPNADIEARREKARKLQAARQRPAPANPLLEAESRAAARENPGASPPVRLSRRARQQGA